MSPCVVVQERCAPCTQERDELAELVESLREDVERTAMERDDARRLVDQAVALAKAAREEAASARAEVVAVRAELEVARGALSSAALTMAVGVAARSGCRGRA